VSRANASNARRPQHRPRGNDRGRLTSPAGDERRTPPTIATWTSRGRNTLLDVPRPLEVHHDGAWYLGDLTATRYEPATGWWGFARFIVRR
jgi:hypothetical protein